MVEACWPERRRDYHLPEAPHSLHAGHREPHWAGIVLPLRRGTRAHPRSALTAFLRTGRTTVRGLEILSRCPHSGTPVANPHTFSCCFFSISTTTPFLSWLTNPSRRNNSC